MLTRKRLKILQVTQYLDIGGLETMILELCRHLDRTLFDVEILCLNGYDPQYIQRVIDNGISVHLLKKKHRFDLGFFLRITKFIRERQIDVLHAHSGCFFYVALFAIFSRVKIYIYTAHGLPVLKRLQDIVEDNLATLIVDTIVPVSVEIAEVLARRMPQSRRKMRLIINGIDTRRFSPRPEARQLHEVSAQYGLDTNIFWVGSVGRLESVKNYSMLIKAFASMNGVPGRKAGLVLVGEGSQMQMLQQLARDYDVEYQVVFLGMQYRIHEILPLLDVFVLSSLTEGTSISLLEAQACGIPAVVTDVGGNGFVVRNEENGFLCAVDDVVAMAVALCRLRDEPETAKKMALASRQRVLDGLDLDSMVKQYQRLYLQHDYREHRG